MIIRWDRIAEAIEHYRDLGWKYIEAPWVVDESGVVATRPPGSGDLMVRSTNKRGAWNRFRPDRLVASGEQSLLFRIFHDRRPVKIDPGKDERLLCCTPCFRDEAVYKAGTLPHFMKVELMWCRPTDPDRAVSLTIEHAKSLFDSWTVPSAISLVAARFNQRGRIRDADLEINGIEVGSYGYRKQEDFDWVYGTGLAEPRCSWAIRKTTTMSDYDHEG